MRRSKLPPWLPGTTISERSGVTVTSCFVSRPPGAQGEGPEPPGGERHVEDVVGAVHRVLRLQEHEQVLRVRSGEGHRVQVEIRDEREAVQVTVAAGEPGGEIDAVGDRELGAAAAAPERRLGLRRGGLGQAREEAADLEGDEIARQAFGLVGVGFGARALIGADELDPRDPGAPSRPRTWKGVLVLVEVVRFKVGQVTRDAEHGAGVVPVLLAGSERRACRFPGTGATPGRCVR